MNSSAQEINRANLLLVDDHPENLVALSAILEPLEQNLYLAGSGEEALKQVLARDFAAILLDVAMPGIDGFETASLIRRRHRSRRTPIIFLTAFPRTEIQMIEGYAAGAVDYLVKPLEPEILRSKVAVFIELHQHRCELERQAELLRRSMITIVEEKKRTEAEKKRREELEEFAHIASHDLREPLRALNMFGQLLESRYGNQLGVEGNEFVRFIGAGATHISHLIDNLVEYAEINSEDAPLVYVQSQAILQDTLLELASKIEVSGANIEIGELPAIEVVPELFQRVFQAVLDNALKFRGERKPDIRVEATRGRAHWLFEIRDNGIGFDPRFAERIFLLFKRLHPKDQFPGDGMGLAMCKRIIERHHGRIWAEAEPGKGTSIFFTLPAVISESSSVGNRN